MANKYLITGGGNVVWTATNKDIWSDSDGGSTGADVPGASDAVIMNANSGGGTVTLGYDPTVASITMGAFTGTFSASSYNPTISGTFNTSGTGVRTTDLGSGTWTFTASDTLAFTASTSTNLTRTNCTATLNFTGANVGINWGSTPGWIGATFNITGGGNITLQGSGTSGPTNLSITGVSTGTDTVTLSGSKTLDGTLTINGYSPSKKIAVLSGTAGTLRVLTFNSGVFSNIDSWTDVSLTQTGTGTTTLMEDLVLSSASAIPILTLTSGTFNANNKTVTTGRFASSNSNTRTLTKGTGLWTLTGTGTVWNTATTTGLTFTDAGTTKITDEATAAGCTFAGGGLSFNTVWFARGANTQSNTISGNNKFITFKDTGSEAHSILFTAGSTQSVNNFEVSGTTGKLITLNSTTTDPFYLIATEDRQDRDYLNIQHSIATPAYHWYAGNNSVDNQADEVAGSGWIFTDAPTPGPNGLLLSERECLNILAGTNDNIQANLIRLTSHENVDDATIQDLANIWAGTTGLSTQEAINSKAGTTGLSIQEALNLLAD